MTFFFFLNDTATTDIYTLSLHDALPICSTRRRSSPPAWPRAPRIRSSAGCMAPVAMLERSEEHTSELQSLTNLVCRLLLEKKKKNNKIECTPPRRTTITLEESLVRLIL